MCKKADEAREILKNHGFSRSAVSVRGEEKNGLESVSVRIRDMAAPLKRIEMLVGHIDVDIDIDFDYKAFNEATKAALAEVETIVACGEEAVIYEGAPYRIQYNPLVRGMVLMRGEAHIIEIFNGNTIYEIAAGLVKAKNDLLFYSWRQSEVREQEEKKRLVDSARRLRNRLKQARERVYAPIKDIVLLIQCYRTGDFSLMKKSRLYLKYGCEYTEFLEILKVEGV